MKYRCDDCSETKQQVQKLARCHVCDKFLCIIFDDENHYRFVYCSLECLNRAKGF